MNKMTARTIRPGAVTRTGPGTTLPPNFAFTIPPPAAAVTSKKVPKSSLKMRRHS